MTLLYRLVGLSIQNSPTAAMMNAAFSNLKVDAFYENCIATSIEEAVKSVTEAKVKGCNVTMPFKVPLAKFAQPGDDAVKEFHALNTVVRKRGKLLGFNTDVDGVLNSLKESGVKSVKNVCAIGSGGASRAFLYACNTIGCENATVLSRDKGAASISFPNLDKKRMSITFSGYEDISGHFDVLFNGTPVGSTGVPTPKTLLKAVAKTDVFFDAVYFPVETKLVMEAKKNGVEVVYGHRMLLHQAVKAFSLFTGREAPKEIMERKLKERLNLT